MPHAVCKTFLKKDFIKMLKAYVTVELLCVAYFNSLSMMKSMEPYIHIVPIHPNAASTLHLTEGYISTNIAQIGHIKFEKNKIYKLDPLEAVKTLKGM